MPNATFEEGSEVQVDSEAIAPLVGWSESAHGSEVFRQGALVVAAFRVKNVAKAAAHITTLPAHYCPAVAVVNAAGTLEVKANGEVLSLDGATALETGKARVYEITFRAGELSP